MNGNNNYKRNQESKKDFVHKNGMNRERSFVRPSSNQNHHNYQGRDGYDSVNQNNNVNKKYYKRNNSFGTVPTKSKPTIEIYRPPTRGNNYYLQQSKSSGNLAKPKHNQNHYHYNYNQFLNQQQINLYPDHFPGDNYIREKSNVATQPKAPRVHFQLDNTTTTGNKSNFKLKRSKSTGTANIESITAHLENFSMEIKDTKIPDLGPLPADIKDNLNNVINVNKSYESQQYAIPAAKISIDIIQKEKNSIFLESLMNICQKTYQDCDKILKSENSKFIAFMWFLTEICLQTKCGQLKKRTNEQIPLSSYQNFLKILVKCCQLCVEPPIQSLTEIECLFYVITSIGRDLEHELPKLLEDLWSKIRDGFINNDTSPLIKKTLLQLIEFRASNWQLSGTTVLFYYPERK